MAPPYQINKPVHTTASEFCYVRTVLSSRRKNLTKLYLFLTVLGFVIPFGAFIPWLIDNGFNLITLYQTD